MGMHFGYMTGSKSEISKRYRYENRLDDDSDINDYDCDDYEDLDWIDRFNEYLREICDVVMDEDDLWSEIDKLNTLIRKTKNKEERNMYLEASSLFYFFLKEIPEDGAVYFILY